MASLYDEESGVVTPPTPEETVVEEKSAPEEKPQEETTTAVKEKPEVKEDVSDEDDVEDVVNVSTTNIPEFEDTDVGFDIESNEVPPFDYGYKSAMTKENFELDIKALYPTRKLRRQDPTVILPHGSDRPIRDSIYNHPNDILYGDRGPQTAEEQAWLMTQSIAYNYSLTPHDQYRYLINDNKARWKNGALLPNGKLRGIRSPNPSFDKAKVSPGAATNVLKSALNIGKEVNIFLYHSGFSVTLTAPSLSQFMMIDRKMSEDNLELGRRVYGLVASHDTTYAQRAIMDLFYDCLKNTSLGVLDRETLDASISVLDVPVIAWVLACAKYPNGFNYSMSCMANPDTCMHQWMSVVNPRYMYYVDNNKLTERQKQIAALMRTQTNEEYASYWDEFDYGEPGRVVLPSLDDDKTITVEFGNPTIGYAMKKADEWIGAIHSQVESSFRLPLVGDDRKVYIETQLQSTRCLIYGHFVNRITITDDESGDVVEITDSQDITSALVDISGYEPLRNIFLNGVQRFINHLTNTVIGLPNIPCPSCGGVLESDNPEEANMHVIAIDPISVFTMLCQQLTQRYRSEAEALVRPPKQTSGNDTENLEVLD